jgi:hypothetical protein
VGAVAEWLHRGAAASTEGIDPPPRAHLSASFIDQAEWASHEQRALGRHTDDGNGVLRSHEERFRAVALPPLRPAAFFWPVVPPWLVVRLRTPELDFLPPRLDAPGEFAIFAARSLDIPFSLSASYCFSFFTLGLLSGKIGHLLLVFLVWRHSNPIPRSGRFHSRSANLDLALGTLLVLETEPSGRPSS